MKLLRILLVALSFTTTLVVSAYDFEANGLYFDLASASDQSCALTFGPNGHKYTGALVIPDEVEYSGKKLKVTKIACKLPEVSSVKFGKNITEIVDYCFSGNQSLTTVEWQGDMVLSRGIFISCINLKNLSYKSICKEIPQAAFEDCSSISMDLSKVEAIDSEAFKGCTSLNVIDLSSIKGFGRGTGIYYTDTFADCGDISLFIIGPDLEYIAWDKYYNSMVNGCSIDSLVIMPSKTPLIFRCQKGYIKNVCPIRSIYLGRDVIVDKSSYSSDYNPTFYQSDISCVTIGALVTELPKAGGQGYFEDCKNLTKITFEGDNIEIGDGCFKNTGIKAISLPIGTNILGRDVFPDCIESISFGTQVSLTEETYLYDGTFSNIYNASTLKHISFLSDTPPSSSGFGKQIYTSTKLLIPYGTKEAYKSEYPWREFWNIEEMPGVETEKVEITPVNADLNVGDTLKLAGTKYPTNSIDTIQWKSSDVKIATVSHDGLVTAVAPGKTTITAISGKVSATCEVSVSPITAEKITLSNEKISLNGSDTITITAAITPETTTDKTIKWTSSDEKIATVSKEGVVTAIGAGTATITATCGEISASCEVTVYEPNIAIEFTDNSLSVTVEGSSDPVYVSLFAVFGQYAYRQTIKASIVTKEEIDLSILPSGTYVVQVISGAMNTSKRIVKADTK